jgi:hypothetical protein
LMLAIRMPRSCLFGLQLQVCIERHLGTGDRFHAMERQKA